MSDIIEIEKKPINRYFKCIYKNNNIGIFIGRPPVAANKAATFIIRDNRKNGIETEYPLFIKIIECTKNKKHNVYEYSVEKQIIEKNR